MVDEDNARSNVAQLFELTGIQRVICVDDYYQISVDSVKELCFEFGSNADVLESIEVFRDIHFTPYPDEWSSQLGSVLTTLSEDELRTVHELLYSANPDRETNSPNRIATLLRSHQFQGVSLSSWLNSENELVEKGKDGTTLFLFDQNLGNGHEDEGMLIIQRLFSSENGERLVCGLLSSTFGPDEEYEKWREFADTYKVNRDRFLLISKKHDTLESSAGMIKLIVLNRFCMALKREVRNVLLTAQEQAQKKVDEIDIYDFEHMVFNTSRSEGVWEPDTLLRLYAIFQRHELLKLARETPSVREAADKIRQTIDVEILGKATKSQFARKVMHLERFESGDYLIQHHIPLDLGDIFATTRGETTKLYMLLAQPCDLMVRSNGERAWDNNEGIFVRLRLKNNEANQSQYPYYDLTYYQYDTDEAGENKEYVVDLRGPFTINLRVLDICIFDNNGESKITIDATPPNGLIFSWSNRYKLMQQYFKRATTRLQRYINQIDQDTQQLILPLATQERLFKASITSNSPLTIDYGLKRIGRLRQPYSGEVLLRFADHNARLAFDHDLDREN